MLEKEFCAKCITPFLKENGITYWRIFRWIDYLLCINGHFAVIEAKREKSSSFTPLQRRILPLIEKAGGTVWVAYPENWDAVKEEIKERL